MAQMIFSAAMLKVKYIYCIASFYERKPQSMQYNMDQ